MTDPDFDPATASVDDPAVIDAAHPDWWDELDSKAVDTARLLAADAVQKAGDGHPGTAMSLAPLAYLLYQHVMRLDPVDPQWVGRDRFILSNGHASLTQYTQLFLAGYGLEIDDLKSLRMWESRTPGHPEYGHTAGVEITTGPLGQGLANGVGMAMAARRERGLYDPEAAPGESPFDHFVYVIAGDGCLQEGVTSEASSLAGTQQLGNLVVFYDDNHISIEDDTAIAFNEDILRRYESYGWHVQKVDSGEDVAGIEAAVNEAKSVVDRPSIIIVRTIIGWPAPTLQNTGKAHGAALGDEEIANTKEILGFPKDKSFYLPDGVLEHTRKVIDRGREAHASWQQGFDAWAKDNPKNAELYDRLSRRELPSGWADSLISFDTEKNGKPATISTRKASGQVVSALADVLPELWGGSADLAGSNNSDMDDEPSFIPAQHQTKMWQGGPYGRNLHFGIREHAMGAIVNGIAVHGNTRPYGATFLVFSDYMRPPVRLSALMDQRSIWWWTHDSIALGGDGPTHQPVEQLASLRAIPKLDVVRPADANEVAVCWRRILETNDHPAGIILSRQNLPVLPAADVVNANRGGYILAEAGSGRAEVILIATGSEVSLALSAREALEADGTPTRVVSMPCVEWFEAEPMSYRDQVLPPEIKARVSVEAGVKQGWREWIGDAGVSVSVEDFGASAPGDVVYEQYGFTTDRVVAAAHSALQHAHA